MLVFSETESKDDKNIKYGILTELKTSQTISRRHSAESIRL